MSDEYTPTTEEVETAYSHDPEYGYRVSENRRGFRRWLAQHEAAIRRDQIEKDAQIIEAVADRRAIGRYMDEAITALRAQIGDTNE